MAPHSRPATTIGLATAERMPIPPRNRCDLPRHIRVVVDAGGAAGLPDGCDHTWTVERPARPEREWLVVALAEDTHDDRAVRLVADQPDERDVEDAGDLLCDDGKELIRRGFARDEGRDPPQGRLFGGELANVHMGALERLDACGPGAARGGSTDEVRLAVTQRLRYGDRPVVQNDLTTTLWDVEWGRPRRPGAIEHVALAIHE